MVALVYSENAEFWWVGPDGQRVRFAPIRLGLDDDGAEIFTHRRDAVSELPPDRPLVDD